MKYILLHISGSWPIRVRFLHPWADHDCEEKQNKQSTPLFLQCALLECVCVCVCVIPPPVAPTIVSTVCSNSSKCVSLSHPLSVLFLCFFPSLDLKTQLYHLRSKRLSNNVAHLLMIVSSPVSVNTYPAIPTSILGSLCTSSINDMWEKGKKIISFIVSIVRST